MTAATFNGLNVLPPQTPSRASRARRPLTLQSSGARVGVVALLTAVAFHFSLASLAGDWRFAGPLADLALVPPITVAIALVGVRRHGFVASVPLGRLDWLVAGVALLAVGGALVVAPVTLGNDFWALRPDMLALPLMAIAGVALLLGTRSLLALVFPLTFLLLAWPLPFAAALDAGSQALTGATAGAVRILLPLVPAARPVGTGSDLLVHVVTPQGGFTVAVTSACSGVEGLTGMVIVMAACMYVVRGRILSRLAWVATGLLLAWVADVVRIVGLLGAGAVFGRGVAMDGLHPVAGLVMLDMVLAAMLLTMRRFGLSLRPLTAPVVSDVPLTRSVPGVEPPRPAQIWRRATALAVAATVICFGDTSLASTAAAFDNNGLVAAVPFSARVDGGSGVRVVGVARNDWASTFYGSGTQWQRYQLMLPAAAGGFTVWLDSITTPNAAALHAHPVANCYRFHQFTLQVRRRTVLADGVVAERFVYTRPDGAQWHTLAWQWPVTGLDGHVRQERVVLFASSRRDADVAPGPTDRAAGPHLRDLLLSWLDRSGPDTDPNPAVTAALTSEADTLIHLHVGSGRT